MWNRSQIMSSKSQFYHTECINAASKSSILFTLGSVIVKGGKFVNSSFNRQRPRYGETISMTAASPVSIYVEMHTIFNVSGGKAPASKRQVQPTFVQCIKQPPHEDRSWPLGHLAEIAERKSNLERRTRCPFRQESTTQRN